MLVSFLFAHAARVTLQEVRRFARERVADPLPRLLAALHNLLVLLRIALPDLLQPGPSIEAASHTASAASRVQPSTNSEKRRNARLSSSESRA